PPQRLGRLRPLPAGTGPTADLDVLAPHGNRPPKPSVHHVARIGDQHLRPIPAPTPALRSIAGRGRPHRSGLALQPRPASHHLPSMRGQGRVISGSAPYRPEPIASRSTPGARGRAY